MSQPIRISQFVTMSKTELMSDDFMVIVDSGSLLATKRIDLQELREYFQSGSITGSGEFVGGISFFGTASYAQNGVSASYVPTASIAYEAINTKGLYEWITASAFIPGIKVGHAVRRYKEASSYLYTTASISGDISGSEAIGLIVDSGSGEYRICYEGIADFSNDINNPTASYLATSLNTGSVYFLTDNGELTATEPSDENSISKPMFIAVTTSSGLIVNYRGIRLAPNSTTSSGFINTYLDGTSSSGSFTSSFEKRPALLRTVLMCDDAGGDAGYRRYDEVNVEAVFTTGSVAGFNTSLPFLTTVIYPESSSLTASFKSPAFVVSASYTPYTLTTMSLSKWKFKIYS